MTIVTTVVEGLVYCHQLVNILKARPLLGLLPNDHEAYGLRRECLHEAQQKGSIWAAVFNS